MDRTRTVLIAAVSGRALAASARRGGFSPLVADCFGDDDTIAAADGHARLRSGLDIAFDVDEIVDACRALTQSRAAEGVVCGSGFEDCPEALARLAAQWPLLGNSPDLVTRIKDPPEFAAACRCAGVPHPEVSSVPPDAPAGWLSKRIGGAGGVHIEPGDAGASAGRYFQRRAQGDPVAAMVLADGRRALVLGFSAQWSSPRDGQPFRYGGAARPAALSPQTAAAMTAAVHSLMTVFPLVGLNSVDFLVDGTQFCVLEINPRPGATLDIFEPVGTSLFALHVAACRGDLPREVPLPQAAAANVTVYTATEIASMPAYDWPVWAADRQPLGTRVPAHAPLCTVIAGGATADEARALVTRRAAQVLADIHTEAA